MLKPGIVAPDFLIKNEAGKTVSFHLYKTDCKYKLILIWSVDCSHCKDLISSLYPWYQKIKNKKLLTVFALSVDMNEQEIQKWNVAIQTFHGWIHHRCIGGINSPEINAYFILSTPTMILVDAKTNVIVSIPDKVEELPKK